MKSKRGGSNGLKEIETQKNGRMDNSYLCSDICECFSSNLDGSLQYGKRVGFLSTWAGVWFGLVNFIDRPGLVRRSQFGIQFLFESPEIRI
jgi:tetrahydromethanopterin S-methyltransferase subunit E